MTPFMILSHHRSGSNFVHDLIQAHPRFECISEPFSMHSGIFIPIDLVPWKASEFHDTILHPYLKDYPETAEFLCELRTFLATPYNSHARGMKETMLFEKLGWLKRFIPELKVIFLVRDPRAVVSSVVNRSMYTLWNYSEKIPAYIQEHYCEEVDLKTPVHYCTWSWKIRTGLAVTDLTQFEHITIRLEDIVVHPEEYLPVIMEFLGDTVTDSQWKFFHNSHCQSRGKAYSTFRSIDHILHSWKKRLSHEDRHYVESNLREEMVQLGYL